MKKIRMFFMIVGCLGAFDLVPAHAVENNSGAFEYSVAQDSTQSAQEMFWRAFGVYGGLCLMSGFILGSSVSRKKRTQNEKVFWGLVAVPSVLFLVLFIAMREGWPTFDSRSATWLLRLGVFVFYIGLSFTACAINIHLAPKVKEKKDPELTQDR